MDDALLARKCAEASRAQLTLYLLDGRRQVKAAAAAELRRRDRTPR